MLIRVKGKASNTGKYQTRFLTPTERIESLAERNYRPTGEREADRQAERNIESALKEAKST